MSTISRRNFLLGGVAAAALASAMPTLAMPIAPETIEMEVGYGLLPIMEVVKGYENLQNIMALRVSRSEYIGLGAIAMTLAERPVSREHAEQLDVISYLAEQGYIEVIDFGTRTLFSDEGFYKERFTVPA